MTDNLLGRGYVEFAATDRGMLAMMRQTEQAARRVANEFERMGGKVRTGVSPAKHAIRDVADAAAAAADPLDGLSRRFVGVAGAAGSLSGPMGTLAGVAATLITVKLSEWLQESRVAAEKAAKAVTSLAEALQEARKITADAAATEGVGEQALAAIKLLDTQRKAAESYIEATRTFQAGHRGGVMGLVGPAPELVEPEEIAARNEKVSKQLVDALRTLQKQFETTGAAARDGGAEGVKKAIEAAKEYRELLVAIASDIKLQIMVERGGGGMFQTQAIDEATAALRTYREELDRIAEKERMDAERKKRGLEHQKEMAKWSKRVGEAIQESFEKGAKATKDFISNLERTRDLTGRNAVLRLRVAGDDAGADALERQQRFDEQRRNAKSEAERRLLDEQQQLEEQLASNRKSSSRARGGRLVGGAELMRQIQEQVFNPKHDDPQKQTAQATKQTAEATKSTAKESRDQTKSLKAIEAALTGGVKATLA